jgi:hypothetical protein
MSTMEEGTMDSHPFEGKAKYKSFKYVDALLYAFL